MGKMKKILFISEDAPDKMLLPLGGAYEIRKLPPCSALDRPVACHADMLVGTYRGKIVLSRPYYEKNRSVFDGTDPIITDKVHGHGYPEDVILNFIDTDCTVIGYGKALPGFIDKRVISVKQGYTRCSTLMTKDCAVSADKGILSALESLGFDTLQIGAGYIDLPGYDCGFIGGASFYDEGAVFFFGDPALHRDGERIKSFLSAHGTDCIPLTGGPLTDYGGAVIIKI